MGTDYDDTTSNNTFRMRTELGLMKIAIPVSYKINKLSLGFAPIFNTELYN